MTLPEQLIDPLIWIPSNTEPLHRALPEHSPLHRGVSMLDRVMYACSNTELKPVMILYGLDRTLSHKSSIRTRVAPLLPDSWGSTLYPSSIVRHTRTFIAPGFAQEPIKYHFATTPEGETVAKDSAAFLLKQAVDLGTPFGPILQGKTNDADYSPTRTYITRIATLMALKRGPLSQAELQEIIGVDLHLVAGNLLPFLSKINLISYESTNSEVKGQQIYERADLSRFPEKATVLARNILKYFKLNEVGNSYAIAEALGRDDIFNIEGKLRQLMRAGVIEPFSRWAWTERQSEAKIMPLGARFVDELVIPLLSAYTGDEHALRMLAEARIKLEQNPTIAIAALDQYKRQHILTPETETQQAIVTYIGENGPQRPKQIILRFGGKVRPQLEILVASGQLKTARDGVASFYLLPASDEQPTRTEEIIPVDFSPPAELFYRQRHWKTQEHKSSPGMFKKHIARLATPEFWRELAEDVQSAPSNTTFGVFLSNFDPKVEGKMGRTAHHGKYYNFRTVLNQNTADGAIILLLAYRAPQNSPIETQLAIREAQAVLRKHLTVRDVPPDDFSDLDELRKRQASLQTGARVKNKAGEIGIVEGEHEIDGVMYVSVNFGNIWRHIPKNIAHTRVELVSSE